MSGNWEGLPSGQPGDRAGLAMTRIPGASILADWAHARWISAPAFLGAAVSFLIIVPLAASDGGYWPTAWSWATLVFAWVAVVALLFRDALRISMLDRVLRLLGRALAALDVVDDPHGARARAGARVPRHALRGRGPRPPRRLSVA